LWKEVGQNLDIYKTFPRLSGECGGKNFHLIHESADITSASVATVRSAFEYSGQKCSGKIFNTYIYIFNILINKN